MMRRLYHAYVKRRADLLFAVDCERVLSAPFDAGCRVENSWCNVPGARVWAHAGSGHLHVYGNSQEAFDDALVRGYKVIEADIMMTTDGVPVMSHRFRPNGEIAFDETPDSKTFLGTLINGRYTPMTLEAFLCRYANEDVYFALDPSPDMRGKLGVTWLGDYICAHTNRDFWRKVIYQVSGVKDLLPYAANCPFGALHYNFDEGIFLPKNNWRAEPLMKVLKHVGVGSVSFVDQPVHRGIEKVIRAFAENGIIVSVAGVNSMARFNRLREIGVSCIDSDFVMPKDVQEI